MTDHMDDIYGNMCQMMTYFRRIIVAVLALLFIYPSLAVAKPADDAADRIDAKGTQRRALEDKVQASAVNLYYCVTDHHIPTGRGLPSQAVVKKACPDELWALNYRQWQLKEWVKRNR